MPSFLPYALAKSIQNESVGHFCHPTVNQRVKTKLDLGRPCDYRAPNEGI
jgi:hypothetical protein